MAEVPTCRNFRVAAREITLTSKLVEMSLRTALLCDAELMPVKSADLLTLFVGLGSHSAVNFADLAPASIVLRTATQATPCIQALGVVVNNLSLDFPALRCSAHAS